MKARIYVVLKPGLLDAQGNTVKSALRSLGFKGVTEVRVGKYLELELAGGSARTATHELERMCQKLLVNPVIETYRVELNHATTSRRNTR